MFKTDFVRDNSPAFVTKANKLFDWLISYMIFKYIYVHHVLLTMHRIPEPGLLTMAVHVEHGEMYLHYDPQWFSYLTPGEGTFIFVHEVFHVLLHHCTRTKPTVDKDLWNTAIDLAANELIEQIFPDVCIRPKDPDGKVCGCFVDELKKIPIFSDIQSKQSAEWYFNYLRKKRQSNDKNCSQGLSGTEMDSHEGHKADDIANEKVFAIVKDMSTSNAWGNISASAKAAIDAAQIRRINWQHKIMTWFGTIAWHTKQETRKRPNRRLGYAFPGSKRTYVDRWLVAVDTSGSCFDQHCLSQWLAIMNQVSEYLPVDLIEFDCEKVDKPRPYDRKKKNFNFQGGGGTSFEPICKLCDERHYVGVIILTDGCAEAPHQPRNTKVLWCLPTKSYKPPVDWGDRVYIEM